MVQEVALLDFVERLRKFTEGRRAVHLRLSRLRPYNRRAHHLRIAGSAFDKLVRDYDGALFRLFNDDLVIICNGADVADIDHTVLHLRYLFSEDPFLKNDEDGDTRFCAWFDLEEDYPDLLDLAQRMASAQAQHAQSKTESKTEQSKAERSDTVPASEIEEKEEEAPHSPLDPPNLAIIEQAIAQADLSTIIRRQPICAVVRDRKPEPVYYEIYTSIASLSETLLPNVDMQANRWLFQDLTKHLDRRMISYLAQDDATLQHAFSVNLNVSTLLSPEFLDFDEALSSGTRGGIVIELQLFDVYADLGNFLFARDFLHERGYKFCLDGTTHLSLPLIKREELGFDLVKLQWSPDLFDQLHGFRGNGLRQAALDIGSERLILNRCDSEQALQVGETLGITLYQGRLLDEMLSNNITRQDTVEALTDALGRHRAATRR
ncbi:MAG: EAL domain-containing protein [Proteobacteria bacterium]|nr:EAL domain-containing protein [Pseudomonadota bacterium]